MALSLKKAHDVNSKVCILKFQLATPTSRPNHFKTACYDLAYCSKYFFCHHKTEIMVIRHVASLHKVQETPLIATNDGCGSALKCLLSLLAALAA